MNVSEYNGVSVGKQTFPYGIRLCGVFTVRYELFGRTYQALTAEAWLQSLVNACAICDDSVAQEQVFDRSCQHYSTNVPFSSLSYYIDKRAKSENRHKAMRARWVAEYLVTCWRGKGVGERVIAEAVIRRCRVGARQCEISVGQSSIGTGFCV